MKNCDVCIIGGGPAGSTAATLIAKAGFKVILLEKELFPRHQIGESLLPATIVGVCSLLGVKDKVYSGSFYPKNGGTFIWGKSKEPWTFNFKKLAIENELVEKLDIRAFQVERHKFDKLLLDNAVENGVEVHQQCSVTRLIEKDGRVVGVEYIDHQLAINHINAKFVIDASGNRSLVAGCAGERVHSKHFNNVAIYGYFTGGERLPGGDKGNILTEAFENGWCWYIPLSDELTSVGVVLDKESVGPISHKIEETFYENLKKSTKAFSFLENAQRATGEMYSKLRVRLDYSYTTTRFWKDGLILIGDAACFVDPVFSSGVHLATFSAMLAARAVNSCLRGALTEEVALTEFEKRYRREYENFYNFLLAFYDVEQEVEDYFWTARRIINSKDKNNYAFLELISGCSSNDIHEITKNKNYFETKKDLNKVFDTSLPYQVERNESEFDADDFMVNMRKELVGIQASAAGINLENKNLINSSLVLDNDMLSWSLA